MPSIAENLAGIRKRINDACERSARAPETVELLAVSKRQPLERLQTAIDAGQEVFGESQVQEAVSKAAVLALDLEWHLIGPLQSNKVKAAARLFHTIHSVDREKIARLLNKEAAKLNRRLNVFFQINIGSESSKHGFAEDAWESIRPLLDLEHLHPLGLMAIPPYEEDPQQARAWFRRLREMRDEMSSWPECKSLNLGLSMGMSHDFEIAIEEGSTHVRVGTDIFGVRPT